MDTKSTTLKRYLSSHLSARRYIRSSDSNRRPIENYPDLRNAILSGIIRFQFGIISGNFREYQHFCEVNSLTRPVAVYLQGHRDLISRDQREMMLLFVGQWTRNRLISTDHSELDWRFPGWDVSSPELEVRQQFSFAYLHTDGQIYVIN